jgi:hypothetical protein
MNIHYILPHRKCKYYLICVLICFVIIFVLISCDEDNLQDENDLQKELNGTWSGVTLNNQKYLLKLNNGDYEEWYDDLPYYKGTYTTSKGKITMIRTHLGGYTDLAKTEFKWYTKNEAEQLGVNIVSTFITIVADYLLIDNKLELTVMGIKITLNKI